MNMTQETEIVEACLSGDKQAFARLMEYASVAVLGVIGRHAPKSAWEDIQQETWIRLWQSLPNYRDQGKLLGFCRTVAVRTCHDWWRKNGQNPITESGLGPNASEVFQKLLEAQDKQGFLNHSEVVVLDGVVEFAFATLKPEDKMLARLVFLDGWKPTEAAKAMGQNGVWARVRLHRMKSAIATRIQEWLKREQI